jgi:hypothetical protein
MGHRQIGSQSGLTVVFPSLTRRDYPPVAVVINEGEIMKAKFHALIRWIGPFIIVIAFGLAPVSAQKNPQETDTIERGYSALPKEEKGDRVPAPQYMLAGLATLLILVIVCKPTRKSYQY